MRKIRKFFAQSARFLTFSKRFLLFSSQNLHFPFKNWIFFGCIFGNFSTGAGPDRGGTPKKFREKCPLGLTGGKCPVVPLLVSPCTPTNLTEGKCPHPDGGHYPKIKIL